jgi:hypothetical protein
VKHHAFLREFTILWIFRLFLLSSLRSFSLWSLFDLTKIMSVLFSSPSLRSSRIAYTCTLTPVLGTETLYCDLGVFSTRAWTWSFVELKFAMNTDYQPYPIPVVLALVTGPDNGSGGLKYPPVLTFSGPDNLHRLFAPPHDLLLVTWVTDARLGFFISIIHSCSLCTLACCCACAAHPRGQLILKADSPTAQHIENRRPSSPRTWSQIALRPFDSGGFPVDLDVAVSFPRSSLVFFSVERNECKSPFVSELW